MDLITVVEELYALPPDQFTATRNDRSKEAKAAGDAQLAKDVKALPKPSTAAWVVNALMRHRSDEMEQLLTVGASLREAQDNLDAEALRELSVQRRRLTSAVTRQGRAMAAELGHRITDAVATQVEDTLTAAMVDDGAASAVRSGLLTESLSTTGLDALDVSHAVAVPEAIGRTAARAEMPEKKPPKLTVVADETGKVEEAEKRAAEAEAHEVEVRQRLAKAEKRVAKVQARSLQLQGELEEVRRRADALEHELESVDDELSAAEEKRDASQDLHARAQHDVEAARQQVTRLKRKRSAR